MCVTQCVSAYESVLMIAITVMASLTWLPDKRKAKYIRTGVHTHTYTQPFPVRDYG